MDFTRERSTPLRRFALYLPDQDCFGKELEDAERWIQEACYILTTITGGATRLPPAKGMWLNRTTGQIIQETTHVVFTYFDPQSFFKDLHLLHDFVARFGRETMQEAVMVELDNKLFFISDFDEGPKRNIAVVA